MRLLVLLENSKTHETFMVDVLDREPAMLASIAERIRIWLTRAGIVASQNRICTSFTVSVHHMDSTCDHEVPG